MAKVRVTLFVPKEKVKELKKRAIDENLSLSDYLALCSDFLTQIDIIPRSSKMDTGEWIPMADINIWKGNQVRHLGWKWMKKRFESRAKADFWARAMSKQKLRREGYFEKARKEK